MHRIILILSNWLVLFLFIASCASSSNGAQQGTSEVPKSDVPQWYQAVEKGHPEYITAVASATSTQKEFARKNALLTARSKLAKQIHSEIASVTFSFRSEQRTNAELNSQSELLRVIKVAADEKVANTEVLKEKMVFEEDTNRFESFVMIGVSKEEFKSVLSNELKSYSDEQDSVKEFEQKLKQKIDSM